MNRKDNIRYQLANKDKIKAVKKAARKYTDGAVLGTKPFKMDAQKMELPDDTDEVLYRTIIANTYNYMDSHDDVHLNGCFAKSVSENKNQLYLKDHVMSVDKIAGKVLEAYEHTDSFKAFGYDSDKMTQALLKNVAIFKADDESFYNKMLRGQINQHSVGMQYIQLFLAADDVTSEDEYKLYTELLPKIANFEAVEANGYFWAVKEAREFETSAVTLGSNDLTGIFDANGDKTQNNDAADKLTAEIKEPLKPTKSIYHFINY